MNHVQSVSTVDYHTAGEPFRIVTGGVPPLSGRTILAKRSFAQEHLDGVRRLLIHEPRGHADMYGCFVTEPVHLGSDLGVVFFHNAGYSTACGHGTIALATWAIDHDVLPGRPAHIRLDAPSGTLEVEADVVDGRVGEVRFQNVPSFVYLRDVLVATTAGEVAVDIAYGGAFYACVDVGTVGRAVAARDLDDLIRLGREIKHKLESEHEILHPAEPQLRDIYGVIFYQRERGCTLTQRNVTIFADGEVDRSPCGSGTSARLALLDESGELPRGETLRHLSIVDTAFSGRVLREGPMRSSVITEIGGRAHMTGRHQFVLDPYDQLGTGFLLR
jgi:proline racemase